MLIRGVFATFQYTKVCGRMSGKYLADYMEQSLFGEAVSAIANQQIVRILWNLSSSTASTAVRDLFLS